MLICRIFILYIAGIALGFAQETQTGIASFYSDHLEGRKTASGEKYYKDSLTAAHKTLPFGTVIRVVNTANKKEVIVRINDRGPFVKGRILDLSKAAARVLGILKQGKARVYFEIVKRE